MMKENQGRSTGIVGQRRALRWLLTGVLILIQGMCDASRARAREADQWMDLSLQKMMQSRSIQELKGGLEPFRKLKIEQDVCDAELRGEKMPVSCFELVQRQESMQFITPRVAALRRNTLSRLCIQRVPGLMGLVDFRRVKQSAFLSATCRSAVEEREKDLIYQAEETQPELLFEEPTR